MPRRTASDKMLHDKVFNIAKNTKHDGKQRGLVSRVYIFFDKKLSVVAVTGAWSEILATQNKFSTKSRANNWQKNNTSKLLEKLKNEKIYIFSKYSWIIPLLDKKGNTFTNAFQKVPDETNYKPNNI